jgi:hypothetical protein
MGLAASANKLVGLLVELENIRVEHGESPLNFEILGEGLIEELESG